MNYYLTIARFETETFCRRKVKHEITRLVKASTEVNARAAIRREIASDMSDAEIKEVVILPTIKGE